MSLLEQPVLGVAGAAPSTKSHHEKIRYVYVISCTHSGSTLVGCLLGAHPDVSTVGEFGAVFASGWSFRCSCGQTLGDCDFWQTWREVAERDGIPFHPGALGVNAMDRAFRSFWDRLHVHLFPHRAFDWMRDQTFGRCSSSRKRFDAAIDKTVKLVRHRCTMDGSRVFVDTTKPPGQVPLLARHPEVDRKVISLARDGRGVMKSLIEKENRSPEWAVSSFVSGTKYRLRAERRVPAERLFRLRLEDLCAAPEAKIRELKLFVGLDPKEPVDYVQHNRHVIGNRMRHSFDGVIRQDESWRTHLTQQHLDLFEARAGQLNRRLGYVD